MKRATTVRYHLREGKPVRQHSRILKGYRLQGINELFESKADAEDARKQWIRGAKITSEWNLPEDVASGVSAAKKAKVVKVYEVSEE